MTTRRYDPTDPEQASEWQQTEELRRAQLKADLNWLLSAPQGRRLLAKALVEYGLLGSSYAPGDALGSAFTEGKRAAAVDALAGVTLMADGPLVTTLLHEVFALHATRGRPSTRA